ncbi:MAG: 2TM domain-containing protein [Bacteroidales bacterium]|nr:2TM domain-containing protein [Bacteroidales bacterium]
MAENNNLIDPQIYKKANQRSHFKFHLAIYALAMLVIWIIYIFLFRATAPDASVVDTAKDVINQGMTFLKFSVLVTALWTVIVVFHGLFVYKFNSSMLEKEIKALEKEIKEQEEKKRELLAKRNNSEN